MRNAPAEHLPLSKKVSTGTAVVAGLLAHFGSAANIAADGMPPTPEPNPIVAKAPLTPKRLQELSKNLGDPIFKARWLATNEFDENMDLPALATIVKLTRNDALEVARRAEQLKNKHYDGLTRKDRLRYYNPLPKRGWPWICFPKDVALPKHLQHLEGREYDSSHFLYLDKERTDAHFPQYNSFNNWRSATKYFMEDLADDKYLQSFFVENEEKEMFLQRGVMERAELTGRLWKIEDQWHKDHPPPKLEWRRLLPVPPPFLRLPGGR